MPPVANDAEPPRDGRARRRGGPAGPAARRRGRRRAAGRLPDRQARRLPADGGPGAGGRRVPQRPPTRRPARPRPGRGPPRAPGTRPSGHGSSGPTPRTPAITLGPGAGDLTHAGALFEMRDDEAASTPGARSGPDAAGRLDRELPAAVGRRPGAARPADALDLATIRQAAARDAINAIALAEVVAALTARGIPIRCPIIADGTPQQFRWRATERRFAPVLDGAAATGPAPDAARSVGSPWSASTGTGCRSATTSLGRRGTQIPIQSITPSNQLSYVVRLAFDGPGDPGQRRRRVRRLRARRGATTTPHCSTRCCPCTWSRWPTTRATTRTSTAPCSRPGTATRRRSRCCSSRTPPGTSTARRPSSPMFLEQVRTARQGTRILFTSKPSAEKVRALPRRDPPRRREPQPRSGDVRIGFDGDRWMVERHAIRA